MNALARSAMIGVACWWVGAHARAATVDSFDDIVYWTGAGSNRAAIAIDFDGGTSTDQSLVWGFRWDGAALGRDMIYAVVTADPRLYVKIDSPTATQTAFYGFGYDRNDDGAFAATSVTAFDEAGIAAGAPANFPTAVDPSDWYREGWEKEFWRYGYSRDNPWTTGAWATPERGPSQWPLQDGEWNSWAFTPVVLDDEGNYPEVFAANPVIATPPGGRADFDGDGDVDGSDMLVWQRGLGLASPTPMDGDANGDGLVGGRDLTIWRDKFAGGPASAVTTSVPEPTCLTTCASAMFVVTFFARHRWRNVS